ncbi:N-methyl-L-tryptophan oxidase [Kaistia dalseonensis]|uniref:Sarcosine oxidase n=1 Tax=Kaistia dalseonensis TaxID=410840 RepID=A0ABU0HDZ0_9HYPH|nr:N-methyl-L-tryptophan oxidase [Kaistia dalseonensis]MCX5497095.1 N-methyl-L-tryptophan oxidase [Kaistia dalseonensis]MDQ0439721.1 sarcosine oxidase [Kaistia dalseonensis]
MSGTYDVIVVGMGGMGSAACWQLARRGLRVLGLERFDLGHAMGSSHGLNRIIRLAYFEHPSYVPLLRRAYELWREAETLTREQLLFITGSIDGGPEGSHVVEGSLASCREHNLPHEVLTAAETAGRFPGYRLPEDYLAVFQPDGGFVASERAILAHTGLAIGAGATIHAREMVREISPRSGRVVVTTDRASYEAGRVIVSAGGWISDLIPALKGKAVAERQVLGWFQPKVPALFTPERFPVSNVLTDFGHYYQFPTWGIPGFKIGLYHHLHESGHAESLSREPTPRDEEILRAGMSRLFPDANGSTLRLSACLFTNTPDEHFVIDTLPGSPDIIVASPCSGHGFKFASVVGEILADFATDKRSPFDLSLFSFDRLAA